MKKLIFLTLLLSALFITGNAGEGDYIIKYRSDVPMFYSAESAENLGAGMYLVSREKALALKEAGMLELCEPDREFYFCEAPNDTLFDTQWNIPIINAEYAWSLKTYGNDVLIGVIDSGLDSDHPDIDHSRVVEGYNFAAQETDANYNSAIYDTEDRIGHGTKVAGIIAAKRNNGAGLAGIADKTKIIPLKCTRDNGAIFESSVINAIAAGAGYFGCDVLSLSICADQGSNSLQSVINYANDLGCIVICSAGNNDSAHPGNHIRYPAGCDGVIAVGSTTQSNSRAETSVVNESVFICAPAAGIPVLNHSGNYSNSGGTSFAAPQVAAAAAIAKSINPDLTPEDFADILKNTAFRPDAAGTGVPVRDNQIGYGILDIEAMIKYMLSGRKTYVSPLDSSKSVSVFNLTDSEISLTSIFAAYSGNAMADHSIVPVKIAANGYYTHNFSTEESYGLLRHFLWDSMENIAPYEKNYASRELER